jgi:hypothetical protein
MRTTHFNEGTLMRKFCIVLVVASGLGTLAARAQVTNVPPTELEAFEAQTGTVIVKGAGQIGSLAVDAVNIVVISKESLDVTSGRRQYGMAVETTANNRRVWKKVVDYDEMGSLLSGLNYLAKIDYKVTAQPTFVASYVTRSGLRVGAFTSQRRGALQYFLQDYGTNSPNSPKILITSAQLSQFQDLVDETLKDLDSLQASH